MDSALRRIFLSALTFDLETQAPVMSPALPECGWQVVRGIWRNGR
jgi:hypothetical protein